MADYIPSHEAMKIRWLWNLMVWLAEGGAVNGLAHGFTLDEICGFYFTVFQAKLAADNCAAMQAAARAATAHKNAVIGETVALARDYVQMLQHDLSMTDAERAAAGITVPDAIKTAESPERISRIVPPLLLLDFSIRHQVTIHWGPNPGNEHQNARPHGVMGCEIQYAKGGVPQEETAWISLGLDTESPMQHHVTETAPTTYVYRARYVDKKLNYGNFGDPAECTVSV